MGRIRTLKPEFHSHEELSALPPETHLLAAALVNYADDEGYFNAHPVLVKAGTTPLRSDPTPLAEQLHQLAKIGYIELAQRGDKCFGRIVTFTTHQRVSHPCASKLRSKFEELPRVSGGTLELFAPEQGTGNREGNREQGRAGASEARSATRMSGTQQPVTPPTEDLSTAVLAIVCAHPRARLKAWHPMDVPQADASHTLDAIHAEVAQTGCTPAQAATMILERVAMLTQAIPQEDWKFFKPPGEFMRLREYRLEPEAFRRGDNSNGNPRTLGNRKADAANTALARAHARIIAEDRDSNQAGDDVPGSGGGAGRGSPGQLLEGPR